MGSKSSSKQSTSSSTTNLVPTASGENSIALAANEGSSISVLDGGAIEQAFNFAEGIGDSTLQILDNTFGSAYGFLERSQAAAIEAVNENANRSITAIEKANSTESSEQSRQLFWIVAGLLGVSAVAGVAYIGKGK